MRVVFAGTPDFALVTLEALVASRHQVAAVYTQPDRPAGRGRRPTASPVKRFAQAQGLAITQPATLRDAGARRALAELRPEVMVVAAYGLILPAPVLASPELGCINVHASLLPRWRGAAPIQRAILAGDATTGVSIMQMDEGLDTGAVLAREPLPIRPDDTGGTLHDRLAALGARALLDTLDAVERGTAHAESQDDAHATYAARLSKSEAAIDWRSSALEIERMVRAFDPWPVAHTTAPGLGNLRIWRARPLERRGHAPPGEVLARDDGLLVATGDGTLAITELQAPGGRRMPVHDFLNARDLAPGTRLG